MAHFALQVVSGREMVVKNALEIAIFNHKRTDIKEIVVPSQTVLDLTNASKKRCKAKTIVAFPSYVFINVESKENLYQELSGEQFTFLNSLPNVNKVLISSLDNVEMESILSAWENPQHFTTVAFNVVDETEEKSSSLMKAKEIIAKNKVISTFKRFVQSIGHKKQELSTLHYKQNGNIITVYSPLGLLMNALEEASFTLGNLVTAPHELLRTINGICHDH